MYNLGGGPQGYPGLREFVAGKLDSQRGIAAAADDILITSGSLQGLDLVNQVLLEPRRHGDHGAVDLRRRAVAGEAPGRKNRGCSNRPGRPPDRQLAAMLEGARERGSRGPNTSIRSRRSRTLPATVLSLERRKELLGSAGHTACRSSRTNATPICSGRESGPPRSVAWTAASEVIHIGSFSKSLAPALRLGYVTAPWEIMSRLLACKADGGTPAVEQMIVADYFGQHFEDHVTRLKRGLVHKLEVLMGALEEQFGTAAEFDPAGGRYLSLGPAAEAGRHRSARPAGARRRRRLQPRPGMVDRSRAPRARASGSASPSRHPATSAMVSQNSAEICHREYGVPQRSANVARQIGRSRPAKEGQSGAGLLTPVLSLSRATICDWPPKLLTPKPRWRIKPACTPWARPPRPPTRCLRASCSAARPGCRADGRQHFGLCVHAKPAARASSRRARSRSTCWCCSRSSNLLIAGVCSRGS